MKTLDGGLEKDTIAAIATPSGRGGVSIIRVSGPEARSIADQITEKSLQTRTLTISQFRDVKGNIIDEGLTLVFNSPASYTGEDVAEFHGHGGVVVTQLLLQACLDRGARMARPGEFSERAFLNNKIDLTQAESLADLIDARTEQAARQASASLRGVFSAAVNALNEKVVALRAYVEAAIDFPEEDLPADILKKIGIKSQNIISEIEENLNDKKVGEIIREGFRIAIIGPPNVGKSSLLNYLSNRDVAIVSSTAGTTRDVIETHLNIEGFPVIISDTAGIRDARNEIERKGIKLSLKKADESDLNIIMIEAKSKENQRFLDSYASDKALLVVNKVDSKSNRISSKLKKLNPILLSIKKQKNINKLINSIKQKIKNQFKGSENILITRERHRKNLEDCLINLKKFNTKKKVGDFDKAAEDLRLATRSLGKITGKVDVEDILDSIFNDFCIGK